MRIDDRHYLLLLHKAMTETVIPDLQSLEGARVAAIVVGGIDELLRRQRAGDGALERTVRSGIELARRLQTHLRSVDGGVAASSGSENAELESIASARSDAAVRYRDLLGLFEKLLLPLQSAVVGTDRERSRAALGLMADVADWERAFVLEQLEPPTYPPTAATIGPLDPERVRQLVAARLGSDAFRLSPLERIPGGMSKQTYRVELDRDGRREPLIVRKAADRPLVDIGAFVLRSEFELVQTLFRAGYLLPEPLWLSDATSDSADDFYLMRQVRGSTGGSLFETAKPIPEKVLLGMAEQLAILHSLPLDRFDAYIRSRERVDPRTQTTTQRIRSYVETWFDAWRDARRQAAPTELYGFTWLLANVPQNDAPPVLVHGDLTPHNCMFEGEQVTALIDWEGAHFGDPAEDLAYIRPHIVQRMDWGRFLAHYRASGGREVRERDLEYYDCLFYTRFCSLANVMTNRVQNLGSHDITLLNVDYEYYRRFIDRSVSAMRALDRSHSTNSA